MQDIIDKSVGGIMSMSRPQSMVLSGGLSLPATDQAAIDNKDMQTRSTEIVRFVNYQLLLYTKNNCMVINRPTYFHIPRV